MKKIYLLLFLAVSLSSFSQKVFPDSIAYWRELGLSGDIDGGHLIHNDYLMMGDTVVNGITYKNLYQHRVAYDMYKGLSGYGYFYDRNDQLGLTNKIAVVRKDSLKIFIRFLKDNILFSGIKDSLAFANKEYLAIDFGWQPGDTIFSEYYKPGSINYLVVNKSMKGVRPETGSNDTIEYLNFKGTQRSALTSDFTDTNTLIKGIGFSSSFFLRFLRFDTTTVVNSHFHGTGGIARFCSDGKQVYENQFLISLGNPKFVCDSIDTRYLIGVEENAGKQTITAYPNPVSDILTITGLANGGEINVRVTNVLGEEIRTGYTVNGEVLTADVSHLPAGVYFIRLSTNKSSYLRRIIKQ
jgi:hypothetical protein